jgi:hypothetical protein
MSVNKCCSITDAEESWMASKPDALDRLQDEIAAFLAVPVSPSSWEPLTDWDAALEPPEPPSILGAVGGGALLYVGKRHIISGESESLKSWLSLAACAYVLADGLHAVYVDADDMGPSAVMERLRDDLGVPEQDVRDRLIYIRPESRFDQQADAVIDGIVKERGPVLAVIDALNPALRLQGLSNLTTDDIEDFLREVVGAFHRRGVATLIVDHVTKSSEGRGRYSIGSERKLSGVDVAFGAELVGEAMTRDRPRGTVAIRCHKDRPGWHQRGPKGSLGSFVINLDQTPKWRLLLDRETGPNDRANRAKGRAGQMAGQIRAILESNPEISRAECAQILDVHWDHGTFKRVWNDRANNRANAGPTQ